MRFQLIAVLAVGLAAACGNNNEDNNGKAPADMAVSDMGTSDLGAEDTGGGGGEDTGSGEEDMPAPVDMALADAGGDDMGADMGEEGLCDRNGFMVLSQDASWDGSSFFFSAYDIDINNPPTGGEDMGADAGTGDSSDYTLVTFELYPDYPGGEVEPRQITFTGENFSECGACMRFYDDCTVGEGCSRFFLVDSGSVDVEAADTADQAPFKATFTQLVFSEVTIDDETYVSTKVPGGETICIDMVIGDTVTTDFSM